jgi:hypothetical protein
MLCLVPTLERPGLTGARGSFQFTAMSAKQFNEATA